MGKLFIAVPVISILRETKFFKKVEFTKKKINKQKVTSAP